MYLKDRLISYVPAAIILVSSVVAGGIIAGQLEMYDATYWKHEILEEKGKRLEILDSVSGLWRDGVYSVEDIARVHDGILAATMSFNYMDTDPGDFAAYDNPISPGDALMGDLNVRYGGRFDVSVILDELRISYEAGSPVDLSSSNLDEKVEETLDDISAVFINTRLNQQDMADAEYRTDSTRWMVGGAAGFLLGLLGYAITTPQRSPKA